MTIEIPADLQPFVEGLVSRGSFPTEAEVVGAALRLLQQREQRLEELRAEVLPAVQRLDRGEGVIELDDDSLDEFFDEIEAEAERRARS